MSDKQDSWYWMLEEKGSFTVRSCYRTLQGEADMQHFKVRKKLWSMKMPCKVTNFLWRACQECIPTAVALVEKRVEMDVRCQWCRVDSEDIMHVLFQCVFARKVWEQSLLTDMMQIQPNDNFFTVFQRDIIKGTNEQVVMKSMLCLSLWNRRNKWVWDKVNMSVFGVRSAVMNCLSDWRNAQREGVKNKPVLQASTRKWSRPELGWIKINIDAATFDDLKCAGIGVVIRDEHGYFVRARSRKVEANLQPREAETLSLKETLSWVKKMGFRRCRFETDAKQLAEACKSGQGRSFFHSIVLDCIDLWKHFDSMLVEFIHRSANGVTHTLARATHSMSGVKKVV